MAMKNGDAKRPQGSRKRVPGTPSKADMKRENKKLINKGAKYVLVAIGVAAMVLSVTAMACSGILNQMQSSEDYHLTGGVAATVNGVNITEDTITKQVMSTRSALGYDSDEDWAQYLVDNDITPEEYREGYSPDSPQGSVFLDILTKRGVKVNDGLSVIIMNYMDAWSMDVQRLRECSMMVTVPDGRAIPFCSYHLTDADGRRVYPPWCKEELR